jgi:hypothetical protein
VGAGKEYILSNSKLLSVKQVRRRLNKRSDGAVYDLVRKGILPPGVVVRLGWNIQFNEDALEEFIAKGGTLQQAQTAIAVDKEPTAIAV